jgi:hypothetical protein
MTHRFVGAVRTQVVLQWKSYVIAVLVALVLALTVANVANSFGAVHDNYRELLQTKAQYAANGMNFAADLAKPAKIVNVDGGQGTSNIARSDYDALSHSIDAMSPGQGPTEVLKYLGIFLFPAIFFLFGAQVASYGNKFRTEKLAVVRLGVFRSMLANQASVLVFILIVAIASVLSDVISRAIYGAVLSSQLPVGKYPDLSPFGVTNWLVAAPMLLLVWVFYGTLGYFFGTLFKGVAVPAIIFIAYNYVLPVFGVFDPRSWVANLARGFFDYSTGSFAIFQPQAISAGACLALLAGVTCIAWVGSLVIATRRNPLAR